MSVRFATVGFHTLTCVWCPVASTVVRSLLVMASMAHMNWSANMATPTNM